MKQVKVLISLLMFVVVAITPALEAWSQPIRPDNGSITEQEVNPHSSDPAENEEYQSDDQKPKAASGAGITEIEPNDTPEKADYLGPERDAYGKIQKSGDVDYWKYRATRNAALSVWLSQIPNGQDYDLYVYNDEKKELAKSEKTGSADEFIESVMTEKGKWYFFAVRAKKGSVDGKNPYRLKLEYTSSGQQIAPDSFEPNNTVQTAKEIPAGIAQEATIHQANDVDYYKFLVKLSSTITVSMTGIPEGMDLDLYLLDKDRRQVAKSEHGKNQDEQVVYNGDPGTYYVKVVMNKRSTLVDNRYKLNVNLKTIPIILVPGIGGSRLNRLIPGNMVEQAWLKVGNILNVVNIATFNARLRENLRLMPAASDSDKVIPYSQGAIIVPDMDREGLNAIEYLSDDSFSIHEKSEEFYSMVQNLNQLGYGSGELLFGYPYDWRLSSTDTAVGLKNWIDYALRATGAQQVQLIVHSMGGLVAREALLAYPDYQRKVKRIIYMGTPFLGSPRAYQAIKLGYDFGIWIMQNETGKLIAQYSPAVYELLPSREYVRKNPFLYVNKNGMPVPLSNEAYFDQQLGLTHPPLVKLGDRNHTRWDARTLRVQQYVIIGNGVETLAGYRVDEDGTFIPFILNGDGTVPLTSAEHSAGDIAKRYYTIEDHAGLPKDKYVIRQVAQLLQGNEAYQEGMTDHPLKSIKMDYVLIYRKDHTLPVLNLARGNEVYRTGDIEADEPRTFRVEYHGNVILVDLSQGNGPLTIQKDRQMMSADTKSSDLVIERHTSGEDISQREQVKRYVPLGEGVWQIK